MNEYVTGAIIKELREKNHLTQAELAEKINVYDKTQQRQGARLGKATIVLCLLPYEILGKKLDFSTFLS